MKYDGDYLLDDFGRIVMPYWESPIMKQAAKTICKNGGRVMNIGFGLGLIDTFIQEEDVEEHWIVEVNPSVLQKMKDDGWYDTITNKKLMNYEVYKFVSLSKKFC